eukprot:CAMPEP_0183558240 /NCGR_PEP_ID=MMETSP0371-20130417/88018_1 /TAXON_ID=268820 /ORGANISM="Peridinium aciculiferum, Strain PAER-2" /LENGTH=60 /DNA_ID=CAMNT_0025765563 /DNA_START=177 /DNA_END=356 /DNA_ORIENTATION=-
MATSQKLNDKLLHTALCRRARRRVKLPLSNLLVQSPKDGMRNIADAIVNHQGDLHLVALV